MASSLPLHSVGASAAADPTVDLKTLITALESLLTLSQSQIYIRFPPTKAMNDLDLNEGKTEQSADAMECSVNAEATSNPPSLPYVDGVIAGELDMEERRKAWKETESHVQRKLIEIHSKLKNGCIPWDEDESLLLDQESSQHPSEKRRQRRISQNEAQNVPPMVNNQVDHMFDEDEEGETDEGTVSDPSPSPHLPKAATYSGSTYGSKSSSASVGPGQESAEAIVSQCVRVLDSSHGFSSETKALAAQLLAELAKTSIGRTLCLRQQTQLPAVFREGAEQTTRSVSVVESVAQVLGPDCPLETSVQVPDL